MLERLLGRYETSGIDGMWRLMTYVLATAAGIVTVLIVATLLIPLVYAGELSLYQQERLKMQTEMGWLLIHPIEEWKPTPLPRGHYEYEDGYTVTRDSLYMKELAKKSTWVPPEKAPYWKRLPIHYHYDSHGNRNPCYAPH